MIIGIEETALRSLLREEITLVLNGGKLPEVKEPVEQEFITYNVASKILKDKGYNVKSRATLRKIVSNFEVPVKKVGRDKWYLTTALNCVPSKV